jgi:4-hydroxybenzoyl-CoA reductase subunit beta
MMRVPRLRHVRARSLADAARALHDGGPGTTLLAGGTDLIPKWKRRQTIPELVVSIRRLEELRRIDGEGEVVIGAGTTIAELAGSSRITAAHLAVARAASQVATPQIRNTATLGGNLLLDTRCSYYDQSLEWRQAIGFCRKAPADHTGSPDGPEGASDDICWVAPSGKRCWAVSSSDTAPALIALGASVRLVSVGGEREIPLELLYRDDGIVYTTKQWDEIVTAVRIPTPAGRSTYWKLRRRGSFDFPAGGVAAAIRFSGDGVVEEARVVVGAVASRPILLSESTMLIGKRLTDDVIEEFALLASRHAKPLDNTDFAMTWRKATVRHFLGGVLRELRGDDPSQLSPMRRRSIRAEEEMP